MTAPHDPPSPKKPAVLAGLGLAYMAGLVLFVVLVMIAAAAPPNGPLFSLDQFPTLLGMAVGGGGALGYPFARRLSGGKVELGLAPIGAIGAGVACLALAWLARGAIDGAPLWNGAGDSVMTAGSVAALMLSACLFAVPLDALLLQRRADGERGVVTIARVGKISVGLLAIAIFWLLHSQWHPAARAMLATAGLVTLAGSAYVLGTVPEYFVRFTLWLLTHTIYRITLVGKPNVPARGPALLVCNHISFVDGALVGACLQRFVRFIVWRPIYDHPAANWLMRRLHAIPIDSGSKREIIESIERARDELRAGHVVCIFAEGSISRTGNLLPFKRGFERIIEGIDAPVIPVYLDRVWGSVFSFKLGRFLWKRPERLPYPVTVVFGDPLPPTTTARQARAKILDLGADAQRYRHSPRDLLHVEFMRTAKRRTRPPALADSTNQRLTRGHALISALALARLLTRRCQGERMLGVLLPASVGGALVNVAAQIAGLVPVNLNFTAGRAAIDEAIRQCELRTIITSRRFIERASIEPRAGMVFLEDLRKDVTPIDRALAWLQTHVVPVSLLRRVHRHGRTSDSLATVIFSSGSTGLPKGVMLSHRNILANVDALEQVFPTASTDCMLGVLPFFHSFGFTGTLWFPLIAGIGAVYHPNPLDAKTVGELAEAHRMTMLIGTPTMCQAYVRRCTPKQFAHLRYAIVGAEKLREPLATQFQERFGVRLLEGYGCTEMSPVVAVNTPDVSDGRIAQTGTRPGSVGPPVPGVAVKIVELPSDIGLRAEGEGLVLVKGPNMMLGYLGQPERTAEVIRDGWYTTGDIGRLDDDGFLFITDRLSRFSKIGGEMVPHLKVEDTINGILGEPCSVVAAVADAAKGERLIAFYTHVMVEPETLWGYLNQTELPKLWIPRRDCLFRIDEIPTLGTGKTDLRRILELARERLAPENEPLAHT